MKNSQVCRVTHVWVVCGDVDIDGHDNFTLVNQTAFDWGEVIKVKFSLNKKKNIYESDFPQESNHIII